MKTSLARAAAELSRPHRRRAAANSALRRTVLVALVTATLATSACNHNTRTPPAASATAGNVSQPAPAATTTSERHYPATAKACDLLDNNRLVNALGIDAGTLITPTSQQTRLMSIARCVRQYGAPASRSLVELEVTVVKDASAEPFYSGLRAVHTRQYHLTDLPGLGQGAYSYTDPDTGPHVVAYDGNLYLTLLIHQTIGSSAQPAATSALMADEAHHAMTTLAGS